MKNMKMAGVVVDKRRDKVNHSEVMNIIGDPQAKTCVLFDDIADTAGTLCNAAVALKKEGALNVVACITHPVLSGNAVSKINASQIDKLFVTNTIPVVADASSSDKIEVVDVSEILANAIKRQQTRGSISELFSENKN